jgi:hypothetical protein
LRPARSSPLWRPCLGALLAVCLGACATAPVPERLEPAQAEPADFSGHWELNYGQSDNLQARLNGLVRELRRDAARASAMRGERAGGLVIGSSAGTDSAPSIIGLARMAEQVTAAQLLEVVQSRTDIRVAREGNFPLTCDFLRQAGSVEDLGVGRESCAWDGSQLVFLISLPGGLAIRHRLSLAPSGERLGIVTTLFSDRVSAPFTVTRVYDRYDPANAGYRCEMTVSRGRVCTTEDPPP